ncbi:MAG TPA: metalloregulator ArsR/SmtB family transcription factor, partial [Candidatus Eisenbacteria bacterium]
GELTVGAILARLGTTQGNVSQHLAILRSRRLVTHRKQGNRVFYSLRDPILRDVLALMRRYAASHLAEDLALLREMATPARVSGRRAGGRRPARARRRAVGSPLRARGHGSSSS